MNDSLSPQEQKVFQPSTLYVISAFFGSIFFSFFLLLYLGWLGLIVAPFMILFGTIYAYLRIKSTFIEIKEEGIEIRAGVIFKKRSIFLYSKIQDIQVFQALTDVILGLQSVSIKTMTIGSALGGNIQGLKTKDAEYLKEFILAKLNKNFAQGATTNKEAFIAMSTQQDTTETMKVNPWPIHFFKPLTLIVIWLIPLMIVLILIGIIFPPFLIMGIGIILLLVFMIGLGAFGMLIDSIAFKYYVGKTRIEIKRELITMHKNTVPLFKVQDVVIFRYFWNRIIGLADVNIETGEIQYLPQKDSKKTQQYAGNLIHLLEYKHALELKKYVFDTLHLNIDEAHPPLVQEHPLNKKKIIKKTITGTILIGLILVFLSLFFVFPLAMYLIQQNFLIYGIPITILLVLGLILFALLVILAQVIFQTYYLKKYYYNISKDTIIVRKGVINISEITLPFHKIQNIFVNQDLLDRLFGLYDLHFSTVTTHSVNLCHIDGLTKENAESIREILMTMTTTKTN